VSQKNITAKTCWLDFVKTSQLLMIIVHWFSLTSLILVDNQLLSFHESGTT